MSRESIDLKVRESIDLKVFDIGLVSNPDQEDIPNEAQAEGSKNLDVETSGKLKGIPKQTSFSPHGAGGTIYGWINRNNGKWDLIYTDGTDIKVIYNFYGLDGSPTHATLKSGYVAKSIVSNNQEVHIGCGTTQYPQWIGYISYGQFNGNADYASTLYVVNNTIVAPSNIVMTVGTPTNAGDEPDAVFPKGTEYEYAMSYIYDGYQESPLSSVTDTIQVMALYSAIPITAQIDTYATLNKRISGVRIYRRERPFFDSTLYTDYEAFLTAIMNSDRPYKARKAASDALDALRGGTERIEMGSLGAWGEYQLMADIDINATATTEIITSAGWVTSGSAKYITIQDTNKPGASYYTNVGISDTYNKVITSYTLGHGLSTSVNNMMFIAQAVYGTLTAQEAAHTIFRSKPYRYDTFNWVDEKLILPTIPLAMKAHRGKLYVWDENATYIIDPIAFQIESVITGRGCSSQRSVVQTDYGLYWANSNGVYWSEISQNLLKPVQDNLTTNIKSQYQAAVVGETPILSYNSSRNQLLVHVGNDVYAYNTVEGRWDYYEDFTLAEEDSNTGVIIGKDGETYTIYEGGIFKDFNSSTRQYWSFWTKEFTFDDPSQEKKFYKIISDYTGTVTIEYSLDGGSTWNTAATEDITVERGKTIKLRIGAASTDAVLDSISIIYRRLRGKR